ncbi:MAG TPA: hypothetical protein VFF98_05420, partial [Novosphingobium sp.]|nr:hypothetical protein [Novosphingobium sp.]
RAGVDLGLGWPRLSASTAEEIGAFLAADLRHHQVPAGQVLDNPLICGWVREAYAILLRWAAGEEAAADYARLDAIRVAFDEAGEGFAGLVARGQAGLLRAGALAGELAADRALHARAAEEEARARTALAAELAADLAADLARAQAEAQAREGAIALRLAAAEVALAERGRDAEVLAGQLAEAESALRDSRAEAAAAASALAGQAAQLNTARRALAAAEAREQQRFGTLLRAKEELAGALRGLARARAAAAEVAPLQAALAEARGQAAQQAQALEAALAGQAALASARDAAQQALAQQQAQAVVQAAQQAQAAQAAEAAQAALLADATRAAEEAAQAARARLAELEENLAARFHEMAAMARLLQQAEAAAAARAEEANWLRGLGAVLTCRAGWEGWLPPPLRLRRQHQRLAGAGLFDAAAYLAAHPDVRAAGAEPLRHLLQHGLAEGRCVPGRHEGGAA